jgi:hypothetical protein
MTDENTNTDDTEEKEIKKKDDPRYKLPKWCEDVEREVFHFNFTNIDEDSFYCVLIKDESYDDAWISSDTFITEDK